MVSFLNSACFLATSEPEQADNAAAGTRSRTHSSAGLPDQVMSRQHLSRKAAVPRRISVDKASLYIIICINEEVHLPLGYVVKLKVSKSDQYTSNELVKDAAQSFESILKIDRNISACLS